MSAYSGRFRISKRIFGQKTYSGVKDKWIEIASNQYCLTIIIDFSWIIGKIRVNNYDFNLIYELIDCQFNFTIWKREKFIRKQEIVRNRCNTR